MSPALTVTILDMPEILALFRETLAVVPEWERGPLGERLQVILDRAARVVQAR